MPKLIFPEIYSKKNQNTVESMSVLNMHVFHAVTSKQ
jgi:hypothetical protein